MALTPKLDLQPARQLLLPLEVGIPQTGPQALLLPKRGLRPGPAAGTPQSHGPHLPLPRRALGGGHQASGTWPHQLQAWQRLDGCLRTAPACDAYLQHSPPRQAQLERFREEASLTELGRSSESRCAGSGPAPCLSSRSSSPRSAGTRPASRCAQRAQRRVAVPGRYGDHQHSRSIRLHPACAVQVLFHRSGGCRPLDASAWERGPGSNGPSAAPRAVRRARAQASKLHSCRTRGWWWSDRAPFRYSDHQGPATRRSDAFPGGSRQGRRHRRVRNRASREPVNRSGTSSPAD